MSWSARAMRCRGWCLREGPPLTTPDPSLPTVADVRRAAERIAGHAVLTPLVSSPFLDERVGGRILLKCENLQRTGSFKFRGAYNALAALSRETRARGVVAVSSGNHAQGVAEAARLFGVRATIIMPADAPETKRLRTERSGGRIVTYDRAGEDRDAVAARTIAEHGGTLIHPFNDAAVIAGQGTIGLEIAADCAALGVRPDAVLMPASGGGLSAGIGLAVRDWSSQTEIVLVEPEGFDDYRRSLAAGEIVANAAHGGVGLRCAADQPAGGAQLRHQPRQCRLGRRRQRRRGARCRRLRLSRAEAGGGTRRRGGACGAACRPGRRRAAAHWWWCCPAAISTGQCSMRRWRATYLCSGGAVPGLRSRFVRAAGRSRRRQRERARAEARALSVRLCVKSGPSRSGRWRAPAWCRPCRCPTSGSGC